MGLDMYLKKGKKIKRKMSTEELEDLVWELDEIGYWRKANQVHNYFCIYGEEIEEARLYKLNEDVLRQLLNRCIEIQNIAEITEGLVSYGKELINGEWQDMLTPGKIIKNKQDIAKILPTCSGFFFGSTDYDEYYMRDIEQTEEIIRDVLESTNFENEEIYYLASW